MAEMLKIQIDYKGHRWVAGRAAKLVTIARDGANVAIGRWNDEDGIVVEPYVQLMSDTDESEDVYRALTERMRAAGFPS